MNILIETFFLERKEMFIWNKNFTTFSLGISLYIWCKILSPVESNLSRPSICWHTWRSVDWFFHPHISSSFNICGLRACKKTSENFSSSENLNTFSNRLLFNFQEEDFPWKFFDGFSANNGTDSISSIWNEQFWENRIFEKNLKLLDNWTKLQEFMIPKNNSKVCILQIGSRGSFATKTLNFNNWISFNFSSTQVWENRRCFVLNPACSNPKVSVI